MKVILTESQLNQLIQEEVNEANFLQSLLDTKSPDKLASKIVLGLLLGTINFTVLPTIVSQVAENNPAVENVDQNGFLNRIKTMWRNAANKEAQITDHMKADAQQQAGPATEVSKDAISQICKWETRKDFGYQMQPKDLKGYYVKGENIKTYGYGLRVHPNGNTCKT